MGYSDQKFWTHDDFLAAPGVFANGTLTASGTNTFTNADAIQPFLRASVVNTIYSVCDTVPAANTTAYLITYRNGTNPFGTLTLCGTAVATASQTGVFTLTAPTVTTNTFTNTLPNGSTQVTSNTTTTSYNQFAKGGAYNTIITIVGTASGQTTGAFRILNETQELYS